MIYKSIIELEIRTGSTIEGAVPATPVANSINDLGKTTSVLTNEFRFVINENVFYQLRAL